MSSVQILMEILEYQGGGDPPGITPGDENLYLPNCYEAVDFYAIMQFSVETTEIDPITEEEVVTTELATSVTSDFDFDSYDMSFTIIDGSTVRIDGPIFNVFDDQYYQFVLPDLSTPILPYDTSQPFLSLIKYQKPNNITQLFEYTFLINTLYPKSVFQYVSWRYETAVNNITSLVSQGLK